MPLFCSSIDLYLVSRNHALALCMRALLAAWFCFSERTVKILKRWSA